MVGVFYLLAQAFGWLAVAMLPPALIGYAAGEHDGAGAFFGFALFLGFVAGAVVLALRGRVRGIGRVGSYVLMLGMWVAIPAVAAVPLMLVGDLDYLTALFESVSGFTTTGATVLRSVEDVGRAGIFFRAELQWLGGFLTLATIATVLAATGLGGLTRSQVALVSGVEDRLARLLVAVRQILAAYAVVTVACVVLLFLSGIPPFEAVCIALATVSTGGFMPIDGTFADYDNPVANIVVGVFMLIGATSIVWHRMVAGGRWQAALRHRESYWVIGIALLLSLLYAAAFFEAPPSRDAGAAHWITGGFLTGASVVSTTGFVDHPSAIAALPLTLILVLALVGGSGVSAAGGIKCYRIGMLMALSGQELRRLIYPHSVKEPGFGSIPYSLDTAKAVLSSVFVCLLVVIVATVLLALALPSFEEALTASVAAFSNIGPLYAQEWPGGAWTPYPAFDAFAKLAFIATMILGRLEVLIVVAAFNLSYWRS